MRAIALGLAGLATFAASLTEAAESFRIEEATIAGIEQAFREHALTCRELAQAYLARIEAYDRSGPALNAILTRNPNALAEAERLDAAYANSGPVGPLHCVPLVLKDNYNTADLPTTGGSAALAGAQPAADAFAVARLRRAGAIILGKSNMHEFALGGTTVSSLGGQTRNPYDLTRTPGGSSGGTGAAVAANLCVAGTGSDTVNSIRSPASANALVGIRPTKGLVSRSGIIPVSETQDAIGPIARTVADAARILEVMAGYDRNDPSTAWSVGYAQGGYTARLGVDALKGAHLGVLKMMFGTSPQHQEVNAVMAKAISAMQQAGAVIVEVEAPALDADKLIADNDVQKYEYRALIDAYLATIPNAPAKSLAEIIASEKFHKPSLERFLTTAAAYRSGMDEPDYKERLVRNQRTRDLLVDLMAELQLDAIVYPLQKRLVVPIGEATQVDRNGILAAVTGFPAITMPAGFSEPSAQAPLGVPIGIDFLGRPWSEGRLIEIADHFERVTKIRRPPFATPSLTAK
jgi:amidase